MQTPEEQRRIVEAYIQKHNHHNYNRKEWREKRENENRENYNKLGYPLQDLKNPIDGGSKVEWTFRNTTYPLQMHDKLTNKDYFIKKGVPEKYFPKRYYLSDIFDFEDVIQNLHEKNNINSLVIKPSMMAESKGIMKINKIVPYPKSNDKRYNQYLFGEANPDIMQLIANKRDKVNYHTGCNSNRTPFKGTYSSSIIYEENLNPNTQGFPNDYKFWCVNGEPIFCEVISGRADGEINVAFIDENKQRLPLNHTRQRNMKEQELKDVLKECSDESYKEMMDVAKIASKGLPLIRIDFCLNYKGQPKFIEAQDLYNYHMHRITMDDITREGEYNKCSGGYTPPTFQSNPTNVKIMAEKFHLDPKAFTEKNCKIYNNETEKEEQISSFEKMIGNLIDLTQIDEKDIGNLPYENPEEAKKKEEEAKKYLKKMKELKKAINTITLHAKKHNNFNRVFRNCRSHTIIKQKNTYKSVFPQHNIETSKQTIKYPHYFNSKRDTLKLLNPKSTLKTTLLINKKNDLIKK